MEKGYIAAVKRTADDSPKAGYLQLGARQITPVYCAAFHNTSRHIPLIPGL